MDARAHFQGKKITIMGLGLLGRAVGDAKFLAEQGADLIVTDLKSEAELAESLAELKSFTNITYRLGGHDLADFRDRDFILKNADIKPNSPYIAEARKHNIPIKMSASWFAEIADVPVVGVTGTRGKSTVTYMLYDIMRAAGMEVLLGGNIRGVSTLALLPQVTKSSIALMELDSWQCQGFGEAKLSPNVAVFTTFMPDHMNYYRGDMQAYLFDKAQIFLNQKPSDTLVVSDQVLPQLDQFKKVVQSHVRVARAGKRELSVPGTHNQVNAACALEAARALGIDDDVSLLALKNFAGVEGRLQFVREVHGVKIYNDNNATTPDATLAALEALGTYNTILIMGGRDKGLDMSAFEARLPELKRVVRIEQGLSKALDEALSVAEGGDIVLFSPAYASFGMFKNEYDRNDQFMALVRAL
jgi:UDP-N-acetylmuramoylalanine--D-glutamate ligase